jgi:hypothetical protein
VECWAALSTDAYRGSSASPSWLWTEQVCLAPSPTRVFAIALPPKLRVTSAQTEHMPF